MVAASASLCLQGFVIFVFSDEHAHFIFHQLLQCLHNGLIANALANVFGVHSLQPRVDGSGLRLSAGGRLKAEG